MTSKTGITTENLIYENKQQLGFHRKYNDFSL